MKVCRRVVRHLIELNVRSDKSLVKVGNRYICVENFASVADFLEFEPVDARIIALAHLSNENLFD